MSRLNRQQTLARVNPLDADEARPQQPFLGATWHAGARVAWGHQRGGGAVGAGREVQKQDEEVSMRYANAKVVIHADASWHYVDLHAPPPSGTLPRQVQWRCRTLPSWWNRIAVAHPCSGSVDRWCSAASAWQHVTCEDPTVAQLA